jgi:hypothetical protein
MNPRKLFEKAALSALLVGGVLYVAWPSPYSSSCDSTEPTTAAQRAALIDLKSRKTSECDDPREGCQYLIHDRDDGTVVVTFWPIGTATGSECMGNDFGYEDHIYSAEGTYLRCEGCAA